MEILERRPEVAYVTSWSRYVEEDGTPRPGPQRGLSAARQPVPRWWPSENVAGDAAAVIRRRICRRGLSLQRGADELRGLALYRELRGAGHFGVVIPERLVRYRVRPDSMQAQIRAAQRERLEGEIERADPRE